MRCLLQTHDELAPLILRLTLAVVILPHGLQKALGWFGGHGIAGTIESFHQWFGLPPAVTALVILAESVGSLCLVAGFVVRFAAFSIGMVMLGAIFLVTGKWGFFMNWYSQPRGEGFEFHLLVLGIVVTLVLRGAGRWSIDRALSRPRRAPQ